MSGMNWGDTQKSIQDHFTDGLAIVVGSGLSCSEGMPGMGELAKHLLNELPGKVSIGSASVWKRIESELKAGTDLESALLKIRPDAELEALILDSTASLMLDREEQVVGPVLAGRHVLRFTKLLRHVLKPNAGIPVITTNYDRLIEIGAEQAGLGIDSMFVGDYCGKFSPRESQLALCRGIEQRRKAVHLTYAKHIVLLKPHGSLDWFLIDGEPTRCSIKFGGQRLMITPGVNKYRGGYDRPFDAHRDRANREIDQAARFLVLGYGFNDDHLQTHLKRQLERGAPAVVITQALTPNAELFLKGCPSAISIVAHPSGTGTLIRKGSNSIGLATQNIWDLGSFVEEVLEP